MISYDSSCARYVEELNNGNNYDAVNLSMHPFTYLIVIYLLVFLLHKVYICITNKYVPEVQHFQLPLKHTAKKNYLMLALLSETYLPRVSFMVLCCCYYYYYMIPFLRDWYHGHLLRRCFLCCFLHTWCFWPMHSS